MKNPDATHNSHYSPVRSALWYVVLMVPAVSSTRRILDGCEYVDITLRKPPNSEFNSIEPIGITRISGKGDIVFGNITRGEKKCRPFFWNATKADTSEVCVLSPPAGYDLAEVAGASNFGLLAGRCRQAKSVNAESPPRYAGSVWTPGLTDTFSAHALIHRENQDNRQASTLIAINDLEHAVGLQIELEGSSKLAKRWIKVDKNWNSQTLDGVKNGCVQPACINTGGIIGGAIQFKNGNEIACIWDKYGSLILLPSPRAEGQSRVLAISDDNVAFGRHDSALSSTSILCAWKLQRVKKAGYVEIEGPVSLGQAFDTSAHCTVSLFENKHLLISQKVTAQKGMPISIYRVDSTRELKLLSAEHRLLDIPQLQIEAENVSLRAYCRGSYVLDCTANWRSFPKVLIPRTPSASAA